MYMMAAVVVVELVIFVLVAAVATPAITYAEVAEAAKI
jgi:hypothetical protein